MTKITIGFLAAFLFLSGCQINPVACDATCREYWMDGPVLTDTASHDSLLSVRLPNPTAMDLQKHVIIAAHGFTATTYEWQEFKDSVQKWDSTVLVSLVLLGGHGVDDSAFEHSTWAEWGAPILTEYATLANMGYRHISLIGSSTAGPLILQHVHNHAFDSLPVKPEQILFVDPIIVPTAKILSAVQFVGPILGNSPSSGTDTENAHWYVNRPAADLNQLYQLLKLVKGELADGIHLPAGTQCKVYKSLHDGAADPVSALLLYLGILPAGGGHIDVQMVNSKLHVFTRLQGRDPGTLTAADTLLQVRTFHDILTRVKE